MRFEKKFSILCECITFFLIKLHGNWMLCGGKCEDYEKMTCIWINFWTRNGTVTVERKQKDWTEIADYNGALEEIALLTN